MANPAAQAAVAASDKMVAQERADYHERTKGNCTPNQHECDLIKAGDPPAQKEPTGAGSEMRYTLRQMEPSSPGAAGSYATRTTRPAPTTRMAPPAE